MKTVEDGQLLEISNQHNVEVSEHRATLFGVPLTGLYSILRYIGITLFSEIPMCLMSLASEQRPLQVEPRV